MRTYYVAGVPFFDELYHHGVKGQRWGIRRYQNEDGSLTALGQKRRDQLDTAKFVGKKVAKVGGAVATIGYGAVKGAVNGASQAYNRLPKRRNDSTKSHRDTMMIGKKNVTSSPVRNCRTSSSKFKTGLKVGAAVAGTALLTYGAIKLHQSLGGINSVSDTPVKLNRVVTRTPRPSALSLNSGLYKSSGSQRRLARRVANSTERSYSGMNYAKNFQTLTSETSILGGKLLSNNDPRRYSYYNRYK